MHPRAAYAIAALVVLALEALIALTVQDRFIRPYLGDVLAIGLLYAGLRAVTSLKPIHALATALAIALSLEIAQALHVVQAIGLADTEVARTLLSAAFDGFDLTAYAAGAGFVIAAMRVLDKPEPLSGLK